MTTPAPRPVPKHRLEWGSFVLVLLLEFVLFDRFGSPQFTKVCPRWNDQIQYLSESYTAYETMKAHGFVSAFWGAITNPTAQGTLHDVYALATFAAVGPSRNAALAVNMFAFLGLQLALFAAVRRLWRSRALAWASSGLLLGLAAPWADAPGSAFDFRLDWMTAGLMGMTLCACLLTRGLRASGWSAVFGALTAITLLTRFLTGTYFLLIYLGLAVLLLVAREERQRRFLNLLLASGIAFVLAGPLMWLSRQDILGYYWGGHFTGPESAIRNQNFGVLRSISWVVEHLVSVQIGSTWLWTAAVVAVTSAIVAFVFRNKTRERAPAVEFHITTLLFLLSPALVLVLHAQKSPVVLSIMVPPFVLLVVTLFGASWRWLPSASRCVAGTVIFLAGFGVFFYQMTFRKLDPSLLEEGKKINEIAVDIYERAQAQGLSAPKVATDQITDAIDAQIFRVLVYERRKVWVPFQMTLPISIAVTDEKTIFDRLAESDFVFVTEGGRYRHYPYDDATEALYPKTRAWCEGHLHFLENFTIGTMQARYYQKGTYKLPPKH